MNAPNVKILAERIKIKINNFPYILLRPKIDKNVLELFKGKRGIEIGGPSFFFSFTGPLPVYGVAKSVDTINFSMDGSNLKKINRNYNFVLSCHSLEHIANPIKALMEWKKKLHPSGIICVIVPDKRYTFDWMRKYTSFRHILTDYKKKTTENDLTHKTEIIEGTDLQLAKIARNKKEYGKKISKNASSRIMHHHVFSVRLLKHISRYCNMKLLMIKHVKPFHIFMIIEK